MNRAVSGVLLGAVLGLSRVAAADVPAGAPSCAGGPLAIQVDQLFEKHESYDIGYDGMSSFAPPYSRQRRVITASRRTHGQAQVTIPLSLDGYRLHGSGAMTMEADEHVRARGRPSCSRNRVFSINWTFAGTLSAQCTIDLTVVRDWTETTSGRTCPADPLGMFGSYPLLRETWPVSVEVAHGAVAKREQGNFKAKDITTFTVLRANPAQ